MYTDETSPDPLAVKNQRFSLCIIVDIAEYAIALVPISLHIIRQVLDAGRYDRLQVRARKMP